MLLKRMQPYWRNILKNKKIFTGNYYTCKKFAMILIVLIVFTGCGQNRITEKEEKKEIIETLIEGTYGISNDAMKARRARTLLSWYKWFDEQEFYIEEKYNE